MGTTGEPPFAELVRERTGADFVERQWLHEAVDRALAAGSSRFVLVTGEPGAGKTHLLAGLARAHPDWLRYFIAKEDGQARATGDVQSFLLSMGHQLARLRPELFDLERLSVVVKQHFGEVEPGASVTGISIDDLTVSPFHHTATLAVEQIAERVGGSVGGVRIGTAQLEPRLLEPDNLAHLALVGPAEVLLAEDPDARIVILLDALDEVAAPQAAGGLLHWLATSARLPRNVSIVMTSRPHSRLGQLRSGRSEQLDAIELDPGSRAVGEDLVAYARKVLDTPRVLAAARDRGLFPDSFQRQAARRAGGNFLYLASYARALADALEAPDETLVARLLDLDALPGDLAGIYGFFVETARAEIDGLGTVPIEEPGGSGSAYAWESVGQPVLGVLTVAREPLTEDQLAELSGLRVPRRHVRNALARLRWLLDRRGERVAFFHASVGEFLAGEAARAEHPECWVDETEWHQQIVRYYRGAAASWAEVDWARVDRYGLVHLVEHVLSSGPRVSAQAVDLVCGGLLRAVRREFGAERRFLAVVDRIAQHVAENSPVADGLPAVLYLGVVRHQAARPNNALPPRALGLLARAGRVSEALERAAGIGPSMHQFAALVEILRYAEPGPGRPSPEELLELVVESALTMPRHRAGSQYAGYEARKATEAAARLLAPRDLERALRLWRHGQESSPRSADPESAPDDLYRAAAAAEEDVDRACALIDRIAGERWADCLDLAERAGSERVPDLLRKAEGCLQEAGPGARIRALARLAALWAPREPDTTRRLLSALRAQLFEAAEEAELAADLVAAAGALAEVDRTTARLLLARLDMIPVNGRVDRPLLKAAELWTSWGASERAQELAKRYLGWSHGSWSEVDALSALGQLGRAEALRRIERIHADIPAPMADPNANAWRSSRREDELRYAVRRMAAYDLVRAAQMARGVREASWYDDGMTRFDTVAAAEDPAKELYARDRSSLLAGIGHLHLGRGEGAEATEILEEVLRAAERPARLSGGGGYGSGLSTTSSEGLDAPSDNHLEKVNILGVTQMFNLSHEWAARARNHFFRDPADVVRAVELDAHSTLSRTVRRLAEQLAPTERALAHALVRSIADPAERAIGLASLHRAAHGTGVSDSRHGPDAEAFSQELDRTLAELPRYRWTAALGGDAEKKAWAYTRPDYRVRFELAVRALGCRGEDMRAVEELPFLSHAQGMSMLAWVSQVYAVEMGRGTQIDQVLSDVHRRTLSPDWYAQQSDALTDSARAAAAWHEYRVCGMVPGYRSRAWRLRLKDPVYGAAVDLMAPAPGEPLNPGFTQRVRGMLEDGPLPAAADLAAFAAETRPEYLPQLRALGAEIAAAARDGSATGADALATLAASPLLGALVDPAELLREADRCRLGWPGEHWIPRDVVARLFPVLLQRSPEVALRKFYEVVSASWPFAMALLGRAPEAVVRALGADAGSALGSAVSRGLACTSSEGTAPEVVDGVRLARLVTSAGAGGGRAS